MINLDVSRTFFIRGMPWPNIYINVLSWGPVSLEKDEITV